ncbi:MAG: hypothetical protein V4560_04600 [Bacteroidota bacterium]
MRIFLTLLLCSILFSCHDPKRDYPIPNKKDIDEVVKTVIVRYDSPGLVINGKPDTTKYSSLNSFPLSVDLAKVRVTSSEPGFTYTVNINDLINPLRTFHFNKTDYNYLLFQNDTLRHFKINKGLISKRLFTSDAERKNERDKGRRLVRFYEVSIPIFSLNQQEAYVQFNIYLGFELGGGYAFILRKINGNWTIVQQWITWKT